MNVKKRVVIIGATSTIATHCARMWVQREPIDLILVGRNKEKTEHVARDLRVRSPQSEISVMLSNFHGAGNIQSIVSEIVSQRAVDLVMIAQGSLSDQIMCQSELALCEEALQVNALSPVLFAEAFADHFQSKNSGTLIVIGSVAGDRGRKSNYIYGAAKGLITRYMQGLEHRFFGSNVKIVLVRPGPTDTPMTRQLKESGMALASVDEVARTIVGHVDRGVTDIYVPVKWKWIMLIITHLPKFIFNRLKI